MILPSGAIVGPRPLPRRRTPPPGELLNRPGQMPVYLLQQHWEFLGLLFPIQVAYLGIAHLSQPLGIHLLGLHVL
jgi:hypothetical protein